jgi:hypothetical protein
MRAILIGHGEIGKAIEAYYGQVHTIDFVDLNEESIVQPEHDIMLVAIPYNEDFVETVSRYRQRFKTKATIVFSSVAIGTTSKLMNAVHVPIEGRHPDLALSVANWQVFMGGFNQLAYNFFVEANKNPYVLDKPEHAEAMKLLSTTMYGINIEFARTANKVFADIGMDYGKFNAYNGCYNSLYDMLGMGQFKRYLLNPPEGKKGGHCVTNNAKILQEQYPDMLVDVVAEVYLDDSL